MEVTYSAAENERRSCTWPQRYEQTLRPLSKNVKEGNFNLESIAQLFGKKWQCYTRRLSEEAATKELDLLILFNDSVYKID